MLVALSVGPGIALADDVTHGIGFTKGCTQPDQDRRPVHLLVHASATTSTTPRTR